MVNLLYRQIHLIILVAVMGQVMKKTCRLNQIKSILDLEVGTDVQAYDMH